MSKRKIKKIVFLFENTEIIYVDIKYIDHFNINDISEAIRLLGNTMIKEYIINELFIIINNQCDEINRLHKYNDITKIGFIYDDINDDHIINTYWVYGKNDDDIIDWYWVLFDCGQEENLYQTSFISPINNNLYLKIDKNKSIEEYVERYNEY